VSRGSSPYGPKPTPSHLGIDERPDLPRCSPYMLGPESNNRRDYLSPPLHHSTFRYRNINLSSIDYAFRPRLRVRLTLGGFTVPRKPWVFGEQDSHLFYRYLSRHNLFQIVQTSLPSSFTRLECSPTPARDQRSLASRSLGCRLEPRSFSVQNLSTSELLRTL